MTKPLLYYCNSRVDEPVFRQIEALLETNAWGTQARASASRTQFMRSTRKQTYKCHRGAAKISLSQQVSDSRTAGARSSINYSSEGVMNIEEIMAELERLKKENEDLQVQIKAAENKILRARDISPTERPSLKRVLPLASSACLTVQRVKGGWMLKLGNMSRRFKRLREIWELLIADNWILSKIFHTKEPIRVRRILPRPILRNPSIAPSYGALDKTFVPSTS